MTDAPAMLSAIAAMLDGLEVALCVFDDDDRTLLWNRSFLRFFPEHAAHVHPGEPYRENLRRFYEGRLGADERERIDRYIDEGIARHRGQIRPYTFRHRGIWLQVSSLALPGVGRARVWSRRGTPRLSETEESAALPPPAQLADNTELFEHVGDGVMLTDADNRIFWVNEHFVQMFGLADKAAAVDTRFEEAYLSAWRRVPDADRTRVDGGLATLTENLRFAGAPFELPLPGNRWVRVIEQRRRDGVGFFALVDISVLKHQQQGLIAAEQRARESQALLATKSRLLEATLEHMEQGVMMVNAARVVEVCNRRAIELLGLPPDMMAGKPTFTQVLDYQWSAHAFADAPGDLQQVVREGGMFDRPQRYERQRADGRIIEVHSEPVQGGGVLRTYTDVTERKSAEATQRALEARLRGAQKLEAIGTLAGGIAHDFNNIMAAILGNVAFAREAVGEGAAAQVYLDQINKAGWRARSLVQQILAFSRKQSTDFIRLPLRPLVEETVAMLRSTAGSSVQLHAAVAEQPLAVMGNPTQLQQVLMNLGTNARQALRGAAGRIEIGVAEAAQAGWVHVWVRDDGCGMDDDTRERIFEPFFTTKPLGEGTGLGLAVVHGIIEAHGGRIAVDSAPGRGSTFHLCLPRTETGDPPMAAEARDEGPPPRGSGQHVLYIDDDEVMTAMVQGLLQRLGYRPTCLLDAREAVALVARDPRDVDLVVTDFNMPHFSGLDVVRALAGIRPDLPVLISSGYISDELRARASQLGVRGVMQKEHTLEALGALVHAVLASSTPP